MRIYEIGTIYEFIVDYFYKTKDDYGREKYWFALNDGESTKKYNVPAYPCQEFGFESITIQCKVTSVLDNGYPLLQQKREDVLALCYKKDEIYWFSVLERSIDSNTNKPYYKLIDRINNITHRFYCENDSYNGIVPFKVNKITDRYLELEAVDQTQSVEKPKKTVEFEHNPFGHEDMHHEWKASLVYPSDSSDQDNPDVEKQVKNIMRSIAGFQNAEGGLLYIGVTDFGELRGIEADFHLLNEGDDNITNYQENTDGFETMVRNAVNRYLGKMSLENISFKFYRQNSTKHIFCIITISKTSRPIYREGRDVFKRFGNGFRTLKGDEITDLVYDKLNDTDSQKDFSITMPEDCCELSPNTNRVVPTEERQPVKLNKDYIKKYDRYYMTFYKDNRFIYSKVSHASDEGVITEVIFNKIDGNLEYSRDLLLKFNNSGQVKIVQAYDMCKLGNADEFIKLKTEDIYTAKVAHKYDFLKVVFNDGKDDREKYVRLSYFIGNDDELKRNSNDISGKFEQKGNYIIPTKCTLKSVYVIHEQLPDEIEFVSPSKGPSGRGVVVGQPIDPSKY